MSNNRFTVAGSAPVELNALADQLRREITAGNLPLKAAPQLSSQSGVQEYLVVVRSNEDPHIHPDGDLVINVLEGGGFLQLFPGKVEASAGDVIVVPKGVCHAYFNEADGDSVLLATFSPINSKAACPIQASSETTDQS